MVITIASGKGGTGKTTLAVNLASWFLEKFLDKNINLLDCDVEAPNDKLFFEFENIEESLIKDLKPDWNVEKCKGCGKCREACRYNAIARLPNKTLIFKDLCHSCGACHFVCPNGAITENPYEIGKLYKGVKDRLSFVYGELNIGETAAPSVVKHVKRNINQHSLNIVDAPPGTGCSVVATLEDSDFCILVTEPTPFGLHDLRLAVQVVQKLNTPFGIVINRSDGNDSLIIDFLEKHNIPLLGRIPFEKKYAETYSKGSILVQAHKELREAIENIYKNILKYKDNPVETLAVKQSEINSYSENDLKSFIKEKDSQNNNIKKELMIISGKGGTGKTTVSASFSYLAAQDNLDIVFEDCDVDASDLHLLLKPKVLDEKDFSGGRIAKIIPEACNSCGICVEHCRFDAIDFTADVKFQVNDMKCEGCGLCLLVCPHSAIIDEVSINGKNYISETEYGLMAHAELGVAEENSGKLVTAVRNNAIRLSLNKEKTIVIGDGPPGSGCPVIASVTNVDLAVIVTEPTMSGFSDMTRVLKLAKHFGIGTKIIINKSDLNKKVAKKIALAAESYNSEVIGQIPFDRNVNDALVKGDIVTKYNKGPACKEIEKAWKRIKSELL